MKYNPRSFQRQKVCCGEQLCEPNVYQIKSVDGVSPEHTVNYRQLQDLQKAYDDSDNISEKEIGKIPSINTKVTLKETPIPINMPPRPKE